LRLLYFYTFYHRKVIDSINYTLKEVYVKVKLQNITVEEKKVSLYKLYIESDLYYCNGLDL
jgi:hypothetical protein